MAINKNKNFLKNLKKSIDKFQILWYNKYVIKRDYKKKFFKGVVFYGRNKGSKI